MTATAESILSDLLTLPEEERLEIADRLQDSVYAGQAGAELSDEMKDTLDRRWEEMMSGKVKGIPHEEVITNMRAKYGL